MKHGTERRIWRSEIAERGHDITEFVVDPRITRWKQRAFLRQDPGSDVTQWGVIVEHIKSAPKCGADQIILATLQLEVAELDCGRSSA